MKMTPFYIINRPTVQPKIFNEIIARLRKHPPAIILVR